MMPESQNRLWNPKNIIDQLDLIIKFLNIKNWLGNLNILPCSEWAYVCVEKRREKRWICVCVGEKRRKTLSLCVVDQQCGD